MYTSCLKAIYNYFKTYWPSQFGIGVEVPTLVYPLNNKEYTSANTILSLMPREAQYLNTDSSMNILNIILEISLHSKNKDVYTSSSLYDTMKSFLYNKSICDTGLNIRFEDVTFVHMYNVSDLDIDEIGQVGLFTIKIKAYKGN